MIHSIMKITFSRFVMVNWKSITFVITWIVKCSWMGWWTKRPYLISVLCSRPTCRFPNYDKSSWETWRQLQQQPWLVLIKCHRWHQWGRNRKQQFLSMVLELSPSTTTLRTLWMQTERLEALRGGQTLCHSQSIKYMAKEETGQHVIVLCQ